MSSSMPHYWSSQIKIKLYYVNSPELDYPYIQYNPQLEFYHPQTPKNINYFMYSSSNFFSAAIIKEKVILRQKKLFDFPFFIRHTPKFIDFPLVLIHYQRFSVNTEHPKVWGWGGGMIIQLNILDSNPPYPWKNNYLAEKAFLDPNRTSSANCYMPARWK